MKLIGHAFATGRIDFTRELNPWAFRRIDQGMKQSQRDRILVDPTQAQVELVSAPVNGEETPDWMEELEQFMRASDNFYLQFKSEVLRFRVATLNAGRGKKFVTIGNQDEFDLFAKENWQRIRYFYAERRPAAFCFDFTTLVSHKPETELKHYPMELELRFDQNHPSGKPQIVIDATGSSAPVEIIDWRSSVKEGENARFAPKDRHITLSVRNVNRPFTFLHEDRPEFGSHAYTLTGDKMEQSRHRAVKRRLKERETLHEEESVEDAS